ncbi:Uncharacterised protein [uncultured archaeon]|nr:Uncharacterised protein [uncultured archaeon]
MKMNEPAQYELWVRLPASVAEADVESYLNLRDCQVLSSEYVDNFKDGNMWNVLVELSTPRDDVKGYLEGRVKCHVVRSERKELVK